MREVTLNIYEYNELNAEAKKKALKELKNEIVEIFDHDWIVDDCYLLNPKGMNELLIENTRKIQYDTCLRYIDISDAMNIKDDQKFYDWLGFDETYHMFIEGYSIHPKTITFGIDWQLVDECFGCNQTNREDNILYKKFKETARQAINKFEEHCMYIMDNICSAYNYYHSDEYALEHIQAQDIEFLITGKVYDLKYVVEESPMNIEE